MKCIIGSRVIYQKGIKLLDKGTIGIIYLINKNWATVVYPQNSAYKYNADGSWAPIKNPPNQVYAHSALLKDLIIAP